VVFPLAAPIQMVHHPLARVVAQVPERFARVAVFEVVCSSMSALLPLWFSFSELDGSEK
jgi:hypothetical protein